MPHESFPSFFPDRKFQMVAFSELKEGDRLKVYGSNQPKFISKKRTEPDGSVKIILEDGEVLTGDNAEEKFEKIV